MAIAGFLTVPMGAYNTYAKWGSASIPYYVNPQNMDVSADAAELDVQEAASAWSKQSRASFAFYYAGRVTDTNLAYDNRNVVMFRNASSGGSALATTYSWFSGTSLTEADIVVWDGAYTFIAGNAPCYGGAYITDVLTHEFGHALGLMHSSVSSATMYPYYSMCSQGMRTLDPDDIAGVESLYPSTAPSNSSPSVTIASPSNGESDPQGTSVMFSGSATDTQDGDLSPNLVWTSSIDGQIGAGAAFLKPLSAGTHVITASVKDSGGITNSKQATVTMTAPCGRSNPTVTLSPSGLSLAAGTTQAFTMQVTNNDAATCGASSFALQPSVSAGWTAVLTALQLSVNPGSSAATTLKASVPIGTADGIYPIGGSATNGSASGYVGSSSVMVNTVSSLTVRVATDSAAYVVGQTVYISATVTLGQSPTASARVTIVVTKPDGSVLKGWTPNTNGSGMVKVNFKVGAATPRGTYHVTASATKGAVSGTGTGSFTVQ